MEASDRLLKWVIGLGQFDMNFHPRTTIKEQALADFIAEYTYAVTGEAAKMVEAQEKRTLHSRKGMLNS